MTYNLVYDLDEKEQFELLKLINQDEWTKILKKYNPRSIEINGNNLLHYACIRGNEKIINKILEKDPTLFYVANVNGETCSHLLIKNNWFNIFQRTYVDHPDVITFIDNYGQTIAQIAVDKPFILQWLINQVPSDYKDSMNNLNLQGYNVLTQLIKVTTGRDIYMDIIKQLLQKGVNINMGNIQPINYAAINNNLELVKLLLQHGANPNIKDPNYTTPLIYSVINKNSKMANLLLKHGADINYGGPEGDELPLNLAIKNKDKNMVSTLLKYKPDLRVKDRKLNTPLHHLSHSLSNSSKNSDTNKNMWLLPSQAYNIFFKGNIDQKNIKGETPRNLLKETKYNNNFSNLINSNKSVHKKDKTRFLSQSKMINFLDEVSNNKMSYFQKEKICENNYDKEYCKSMVKSMVLEGKSNNNIKLPEIKKTNFGLFNADMIHNCIYTIVFLKKYSSLMIPTQTFISDISTNNLRILSELSAFKSEYGKILKSILDVYSEFMYEFLPHLLIWRDKNTFYINKNIQM